MRLIISRLLLTGIVISLLLIITGGLLYLAQHGGDIVNYRSFHGEPVILTSFLGILTDAFYLKPVGIIQLGLLLLFLTQILRVALTAWLFLKEKSLFFVVISMIILFILIFALLWNF